MATVATTPAAITLIDSKIEQAYQRAHNELTKVQGRLQAEENALAQLTAQFNEECRLVAMGKDAADPQKCRAKMSEVEQRILGLKSVVAEYQSAFDQAAASRAEAFRAHQDQVDRQRVTDVYSKYQSAQAELSEAWATVRRAQQKERSAGNAWQLECQRNPNASQLIAHR